VIVVVVVTVVTTTTMESKLLHSTKSKEIKHEESNALQYKLLKDAVQ